MTTLIIATRNNHKVEEIRAILSSRFYYLTLNDFPSAPPVVEDGVTFADNARKKAVSLGAWLLKEKKLGAENLAQAEHLFILADDSGLEVDALHGQPGVQSARFAALDTGAPGNSPDGDNNAKLLRLLADVPLDKRAARFRCVIALTEILFAKSEKPLVSSGDGLSRYTKTFEGACEGRIATGGSGEGGFGYDPLFIPRGEEKSFAQLGGETKNQMSHRAKALAQLKAHFERA